MSHRDHAPRHHGAASRQQHAVLVLRIRRRQGLQERGRIVRDPACSAADQAAPVDPDPHARCPVTASPSTLAPPPARSSAGWSAGRASSPRGCRPSTPTATRSSRRARASSTAPATPGSSSSCPLRARHAAALLCPANLAPLAHPRNVIVIHDAAALRHPEWYSAAYAAWQRRVLPALARRALHVVTVSEFSRRELTELLGLADDRISVISGGVDERFTPQADAARARRELGLDRPYVLCVASHTARKNLQALVPLAEHVEVVVAGGHRPQFAREAGPGPPAPPRRTCPTSCCPGSTPAPRCSCSRAATRASGCRCSRRWPPARRWWSRTAAR